MIDLKMKPIIKTAIFIVIVPGTVLVAVPCFLLQRQGHPFSSVWCYAGLLPLGSGAGAALWCMWDFATVGQGTPAPVDPPRTLVTRGLYRWVRNPMYLGVTLVLAGETIVFKSRSLLEYACGAALLVHLFVVFYEEPTLKKKFGPSYQAYLGSVPRWLPRSPRKA
jgi:protein-S-isoprenylcysteine O-methyltransferase Ste14